MNGTSVHTNTSLIFNSSTLFHSTIKIPYAYIGIIYATTAITLAVGPLYVYLLKHVLPKRVSPIYKGCLGACAVSTVSLAILRALWIPVPTISTMGVYSVGIIAKLGPIGNIICLNFYFVCLINMQICTVFCLVFQFSALKPFSWISRIGNSAKRVASSYLTYLIGLSAILTVLLWMSVIPREEYEQFANVTKNEFVKKLIENQPSWIGFSSTLNSMVIVFGLFATFPDIFVAIFAITLTIRLYFIIEAHKNSVSDVTQALERNLYHTFLVRVISLITLYTIPYLGLVLSILFEARIPNVGIILHSIIIVQNLMCLFGTMFMVKHYRAFLFKSCTKKVEPSPTSDSHPSTLTANSGSGAPLPPLRLKKTLS